MDEDLKQRLKLIKQKVKQSHTQSKTTAHSPVIASVNVSPERRRDPKQLVRSLRKEARERQQRAETQLQRMMDKREMEIEIETKAEQEKRNE